MAPVDIRPGHRHARFRLPWLLLLIAALITIVGVACSDDGERITVYSGRSQNLMEPLFEQFTDDTGIEVDVRYAGSAELVLLIDEEGDDTRADVFISQSPGPMGFIAGEGLLAALPDGVLSLAPSSASGTWVAVSGRQRVLVYNTNLLAEGELPSSIFELTEEPWLGRVAIAPTNGSFQDFLTLFRLEYGDAAALEWLRALVDGGAPTRANNVAIVQAVARGEIEMGLVNHYYNLQLRREDPDTPSENHLFDAGDPGSVTIATAVGMLNAGEQSLAVQLIEYLLQPEAQRYFAEETLEYPLASGVDVRGLPQAPGEVDIGEFDALGGGLERTLELIREAGLDI